MVEFGACPAGATTLRLCQEMEATPYTPLNPVISSDRSTRRTQGRWIARIGVALFTGPAWGMLSTVIGMALAFNTLSAKGTATPEALSNDISIALVATMIGIALGLAGAILVLIALFGAKNREKWFFWWSVLLSVFWCLALFPYGLIAGLPILILFIVKRAEFLDSAKAQQAGAQLP